MFVSLQSLLAFLLLGVTSAIALGVTYGRLFYGSDALAPQANRAPRPRWPGWSAGSGLCSCVGFAVAIALGIAGYGVLETATRGGGGGD